jgi:hypothetical protein
MTSVSLTASGHVAQLMNGDAAEKETAPNKLCSASDKMLSNEMHSPKEQKAFYNFFRTTTSPYYCVLHRFLQSRH